MAEVGREWVPKGWLSHSTMGTTDPPKLEWGSMPISLTHRTRCCPLYTHPDIPNLTTPMASRVTAYQENSGNFIAWFQRPVTCWDMLHLVAGPGCTFTQCMALPSDRLQSMRNTSIRIKTETRKARPGTQALHEAKMLS